MAKRLLPFASGLSLPAEEAITQKYGWLGRSGSGKSYGAMVLAESMLDAGAQIIALDWVGIWWSLRLAADGKGPGFEHVYIFGGEHADVPLDPASGALVADLIVDKHISVVLDMMHMRKAERTRFATAFAEQFFHRKKTSRTACHLFLEEAQAFLPQRVMGEDARMVGVFEDIGKVGRNYGIGTSVISQRPQAIHKDVLNQVEVLLAFQTNGPQERKAIAGWTTENAESNAALIAKLPSLPVGEAMLWSPQWLRTAERVHIIGRQTYNASSTPTARSKSATPSRLAKADLDAIAVALAATIEKAKADDPRELRRIIAERDKTIRDLQARPVLSEKDRALLNIATKFQKDFDRLMLDVSLQLTKAFDTARANVAKAAKAVDTPAVREALSALSHMATPPAVPRTDGTKPWTRPAAAAKHASTSDASLGKAERAILSVLANQPDGATASRLSILAGYTWSGTFSNAVSACRTKGYLEGSNAQVMHITESGRAAVGPVEPLPYGAGLRHYWLTHRALGKAERSALGALLDHPQGLTAEQICSHTGYAWSGTFSNAISRLRTLGLLVGGNKELMRAHADLLTRP